MSFSDLSNDTFIYDKSSKTYDEFLKNASKEINKDNINDYFFYYEIEGKKYSIFNQKSFEKFEEATKNKKDPFSVKYELKQDMISRKGKLKKKQNFNISDLPHDETTKKIDEEIEEYLNKLDSIREEIENRKTTKVNENENNLKNISFNDKSNEDFINQVFYENLMSNIGYMPFSENKNSKYFKPLNNEECHYCCNRNFQILYHCERCQFNICESCIQALKTYQHYHKLSLVKTN